MKRAVTSVYTNICLIYFLFGIVFNQEMLVNTIAYKLHIQYAITSAQENKEELALVEPLTDAYQKLPSIHAARVTCN